MRVLRLLAARRPRRAVSTITAAATTPAHSSDLFHDSEEAEEDMGPFFDLDFSSSSVRRASSSSSSSGSDESSDDASSDLDFIISLHHRSRSASPSIHFFPASEPSTKAGLGLLLLQPPHAKYKATSDLRAQSFGGAAKKKTKKKAAAAFYGGRPSFASSTRSSLRSFMEESPDDQDDVDDTASKPNSKTKRGGTPSISIRRYLTNISRRLHRSVRPRPVSGDTSGLRRRLRKSRSASAAVTLAPAPSRRDDSLVEKQDGIASAIAHCKDSFHRASLSSECDSSLLRSRSDPGKCQPPS